ncbi:hypothetical protein ANRL1_00219 [Anaerolineae bacterium]|nr:hypothetical protein ANRL1_00219 [Anaerolineae bacterium]
MKPENLAERIRAACVHAALQAYEDAGMLGLCAEGRWEAAIDALQTLDLASVLRENSNRYDDATSRDRLRNKNEKT